MATTQSKTITRQKWALGPSWSGSSWGTGGTYAGHTASAGYYVTVMELKTPDFVGVAKSLRVTISARRNYGVSQHIRAAISKNTTYQDRYLNTSSTVDDPLKVAETMVTITNATNTYGYFSFSIPLGEEELKPNDTYFLFLWAGATNELITLSTAGSQSFSIEYSSVTTPVLSAQTADMGTRITISTQSAAKPNMTHDLTYAVANGPSGTIAEGVGLVSTAWTVPDCATSVPNATAAQIAITCVTKDGSGAELGSVSVVFAATVPASVVPTIGTVTLTDAVSGNTEKFGGAFVQTKSRVSAAITASGAKGSTVTEITSTLEGVTYTGASWTASAVLSGSGQVQLRTTVTDSRGRVASKVTTLTVLAYTAPQITSFSVYRVSSTSSKTEDPGGNYAAVRYAYSVPALNGGNTASMTVRSKLATASSYTTTLLTSTALSADTTQVATRQVSSDSRWDVQMTVTDAFGASATATVRLPSAAVVLDIAADGAGLGVGKTSEGTASGLDVGWHATFREPVTFLGYGSDEGVTFETEATGEFNGSTLYLYGTVGDEPVQLSGVADPTYANSAANKGYVDGFRWKVLWQNDAPTASFSAQTVSMPGLGECDLVLVGFRRTTSYSNEVTDMLWLHNTAGVWGFVIHGNYSREYQVVRDTESVVFNSGRSADTAMVPLYVLGAKL